MSCDGWFGCWMGAGVAVIVTATKISGDGFNVGWEWE